MSRSIIERGDYTITQPSPCYYIGDLWRAIIPYCDITAMYSLRLVCKFFARDSISYADWNTFLMRYMQKYALEMRIRVTAADDYRKWFKQRRAILYKHMRACSEESYILSPQYYIERRANIAALFKVRRYFASLCELTKKIILQNDSYIVI